MNIYPFRERLSPRAGELLAAVILMQPLLDVLSYFMREFGSTSYTTGLRMVLLVLVSGLGFCISQQRKAYAVCWGIVGGFWLLHMLNCLRLGYQDPVGDAGEYLKLIQFPLWTLSFITLLRARPRLDGQSAGLLAGNFGIILLVIALSYLTGRPEYTYSNIKIGVLGWFAIANTQSAIVSMLCIGLLLWAWQTGRLLIFTGASLVGFGLLYLTGTRLTYYAAMLIAAGMLVLIAIAAGSGQVKRQLFLCCVPLAAALVLFVLLRDISPMTQRREIAAESYETFQVQTDRILGSDKDYVYDGTPPEPELKKKLRRVYEEVYTQTNHVGTPLLGDLLDRFGTERVMEAYHYATDASTLYHSRTKKLMVVRLTWEEQDVFTKLLGFEYAWATLNGTNYDPENDFPALLCYYGWLGCGLYVCFAGYFLALVLIGAFKNLRQLPGYLTVELGAYTMLYVLGLGAGQYSGQALRKPSLTVYLSLAAAQLYCRTRQPNQKLLAHYRRREGLTMKHL